MRRFLVTLVVVGAVFAGRPALADGDVGEAARELALASGSAVLSAVYFPVKLAVGIVGAFSGGVAGALSGGDERVFEGITRPATGGSYFVTPDVLDGQTPFYVGG